MTLKKIQERVTYRYSGSSTELSTLKIPLNSAEISETNIPIKSKLHGKITMG